MYMTCGCVFFSKGRTSYALLYDFMDKRFQGPFREGLMCLFRLLSPERRLEQLVSPAVNPRNSLSLLQDPHLLTEASPTRLIYSLFSYETTALRFCLFLAPIKFSVNTSFNQQRSTHVQLLKVSIFYLTGLKFKSLISSSNWSPISSNLYDCTCTFVRVLFPRHSLNIPPLCKFIR